MLRSAGTSKSKHLLCLWGIFFAYFSLNAFTQFSVSQTVNLDQAEQLILSQSFQFGYGAQPPLYTYIVNTIFSLTGPGLAPLLGLKVLLLSLLVGSLIALGAQMNFTIRQHLIVVAGLVFIPQLIWESQRDLTHSVLATTIAAATLLQVVRTQRNKMTKDYIALGLLMGLGLISKYNYSIFLAALIFAVLIVPQYRLALSNRRAFMALFVALIIAAPHIAWAVCNYEIVASSIYKLKIGTGNLFSGLSHAAVSAIAFITPLWIFAIIPISSTSKFNVMQVAKTNDGKFLISLLAATIIIVTVFVIITGAQQVNDRWYQPLLFHVPVTVALFAIPTRSKSTAWYVGLGVAFAIAVSIALPVRTIFAEKFNRYIQPNMPYPILMKTISDASDSPAFILAETNLLGGNSRLFFKKSQIHVPTYLINLGPTSSNGIIMCETPDCENKMFKDWLRRNYAIDTRSLVFYKIERSYLYAPSQRLVIYWSKVHLSAPGKL